MIQARLAAFLLGLSGLALLATTPHLLLAQAPERIDPASGYLNPLQMNQWVGLDANKSISGRLVAISESGELVPRRSVEVSLVQKGKTIIRVLTDADGEFQFKNIPAGAYAFVAQGDYTFATFGIHVLPVGSGSSPSFEAYASSVSPAKARELIADNWVPTQSVASKIFQKDPLGDRRIVTSSPKILLQNGDLLGQMSGAGQRIAEQDLTGNIAHVFQGGQNVASAPVGRDGKFRIIGLLAGVYDLVVVGEDGTAVMGFEAVGPRPITDNQSTGNARFVAFQDSANAINAEMADPMDLNQNSEEIPGPAIEDSGILIPGFGQPMMGGGGGGGSGFGGGSGGGGGGGLGGRGIGGLLGIAGLAVGVAALSQNDNFNPIQASLIVP